MLKYQVFRLLLLSLSSLTLIQSFGVNCGHDYFVNNNHENTSAFLDNDHRHHYLHIKPDKNKHKNVRVAIFGDQGYSSNSRKVLKMIRDWDADFILHLGDFDYLDSPHKFNKQIKKVFSKSYPYFGLVGNHDLYKWDEYKHKLVRRLERGNNLKYCRGEYGVNMVCNFKGVIFVLSGVGTLGDSHAEFIDHAFTANPGTWKICAWHKNQHAYQLGSKPDETGYEVYEVCRKHGAIIAVGHEHSFARTHVMSNFAKNTVYSAQNPMEIGPERTFMFVAGTGGRDIRSMRRGANNSAWWAATGAANSGLNYGAMLCTFFLSDNPDQAHCQFKDIDGKIWDDFVVSSSSIALVSNLEKGKCKFPTFETQIKTQRQISGSSNGGILTLSDDNRLLQLQGQTSHGVRVPIYSSLIRFDSNFSKKSIKLAQIQMYGALSKGNVDLIIRGYDPNSGQITQSSVRWQSVEEDDDFEVGSVWVSPNVVEIIEELSSKPNADTSMLSFVIEGYQGKVKVYAADNKCLAPALFIQYYPECE